MADWSREEVEATVSDYLEMLGAELAGVPYNKARHRRRLLERLQGRSDASVEFKHANVSAVLIDIGFPYIAEVAPRMFILNGALSKTCTLAASTYKALPREVESHSR